MKKREDVREVRESIKYIRKIGNKSENAKMVGSERSIERQIR